MSCDFIIRNYSHEDDKRKSQVTFSMKVNAQYYYRAQIIEEEVRKLERKVTHSRAVSRSVATLYMMSGRLMSYIKSKPRKS